MNEDDVPAHPWCCPLAVVRPAAEQSRPDPLSGTWPVLSRNTCQQAQPPRSPWRAAQDPASVSDKGGEIRVLGAHGYESTVKGKNGFVCYVSRSWDNNIDNAEFWNPKVRGPMCLNRAAAHSYLPIYLQRTQWVLSGVSRAEIIERIKAAIAAKQIVAPEAGAMSFMLSKRRLSHGRLSPEAPGIRTA